MELIEKIKELCEIEIESEDYLYYNHKKMQYEYPRRDFANEILKLIETSKSNTLGDRIKKV